jgi:NAD(P)-dependent dehydrogenase (short-subunit alcohol dehydrogenase family)
MPVYVITGTNRGLGLEFVKQLSTDPGNTIIATTRNVSPSPPGHSALQNSLAAKLHIVRCDTSAETSVAEFADAVTSILGSETAKIDYLINNAGINNAPAQCTADIDGEGLAQHIAVNVVGPAKVVAALLPHLHRGSVVGNLISGLGSISRTVALEVAKHTTYAVSKAALNMLTVHQAFNLKERGVVVVGLNPGWAKTDLGGSGAMVEPEDSISGLLRVLRGIDETKTAKFFNYTGDEYSW